MCSGNKFYLLNLSCKVLFLKREFEIDLRFDPLGRKVSVFLFLSNVEEFGSANLGI